MTDRDGLIHLLVTALGPNPDLRQGLTETVFAVMSDDRPETESGPPRSYLDILEQLARHRQTARESGRARLDAALRQLSRQLTQELQRSALALHHNLKAGQTPDREHLRRVGLDLTDFPTGIAPAYNLRQLSADYFRLTQDIQTLERQTPAQDPGLLRTLRQEHIAAARRLRDVAWEALSTGLFPDQELLRFSDACTPIVQRQRPAAENMLLDMLIERPPDAMPAIVPRLTDWLYRYGRLHWPLLHTLRPQAHPLIAQMLARLPDPIGLEALATLPLERNHGLLLTLLTLRFGLLKLASIAEWASWLKQVTDTATQRSQALEFWNAHPYLLPALVAGGFREFPSTSQQALLIPEILHRKMQADLGEAAIEDVLTRRSNLRPASAIRLSETNAPIAAEPATRIAPDGLSPAVRAAEGIVETALDAMSGENPAESALMAALDTGTAGLRRQLTVTIDEEPDNAEDAAQPKTASEATRIGFARATAPARPIPPPPRPKEPEIDLWRDRILPVVMQNWAPLLGGSMVLTGLLLLEFYIWDKAAWIRYGVSPVIIALVALVLTFMGRRLNRDTERVETSLAIIQGLAVFLAPLSLLFATLFFVDSDLALSSRLVGGAALSAALLAAWSLVFILAIRNINRAFTKLYSGTLLLLNGLLLLLSVARVMSPTGQWFTPGAKILFVIGFYVGFGVLSRSICSALRMTLNNDAVARQGLSFYSITGLGTFALVWGLMHAHLRALPQPFTYGPLLILAALLCLRAEFLLSNDRKERAPSIARDRITALSYTAYALIGLGLLLCIGQEYARVGALLLAGGVWAYQAYELRRMPPPPGLNATYSIRHDNIALTLVTLGLSLIAMLPHFPAEAFPFLAFGVALALYVLARHTPLFAGNPYVTALSPIYLALAFALAVIWQWAQRLDPFGFGAAFVLFGVFTVYLGATSGKLIHVHAGMAYGVAALPYLGMMDMELFTLQGNTLVFGLAVVGLGWAAMSSLAPVPALRDSRSTVLWNIGILAFCLLCLRLFLQDSSNFAAASALLKLQMLSAPLLIGGLMLLAGYWTNSYPAIYLALVIFIFIFPEIKDQLLVYRSVRALVNTGLGTSLTALSLVALAYILKFWQALRKAKTHDLIWQQKAFPFQARSSYLLFAHPLIIAALFLFSRNLFHKYPTTAFFPPYDAGLLTSLAVFLAGSGYLTVSLWYRTPWFAYVGFLAILVGSVHAGVSARTWLFAPGMLPILFLLAFLYSETVCAALSRVFPTRAAVVTRPFRHVRFFFVWIVGLTGFLLYALFRLDRVYSGSGLWQWLPLMLYFCAIAGGLLWRSNRLWRAWLIAIPGYLLVWQTVLLVFASQAALSAFFRETTTPLHLLTVSTVLAVAAGFLVVEWRASIARFHLLSPVLWLSLLFLGFWSLAALIGFYGRSFSPSLFWQIFIMAGISVILGRYLRMAWLWLWAVFLLHLLLLPPLPVDSAGYGRFYATMPPVLLAGAACVLALLAWFTHRVPWLYDHKYVWPWSLIRSNTPPVMFAIVSQLFVITVFAQAVKHPAYHAAWMTVIGLFLATLPALLVAPYIGLSRHLLFGLPYLAAWVGLMIAIQVNLAPYLWEPNLPLPLLAACGLFGALASLLIGEQVWPSQDSGYLTLKYVSGVSMLAGVVAAYLPLRNIHRLSWQWLLVSAVLLFGSALFFRRSSKL